MRLQAPCALRPNPSACAWLPAPPLPTHQPHPMALSPSLTRHQEPLSPHSSHAPSLFHTRRFAHAVPSPRTMFPPSLPLQLLGSFQSQSICHVVRDTILAPLCHPIYRPPSGLSLDTWAFSPEGLTLTFNRAVTYRVTPPTVPAWKLREV